MKRTLAIFLATLILVSNSGVVFATHYCMGGISDISIGFTTEAEECDMADMGGMCMHDAKDESKGECNMEPVDCCDDDFVQFQFNESFKTSVEVDTDLNKDFLAAFAVVYLNLYDFQHESNTDYVDYSPPLLKQDIPVLFQSFLI